MSCSTSVPIADKWHLKATLPTCISCIGLLYKIMFEIRDQLLKTDQKPLDQRISTRHDFVFLGTLDIFGCHN
jgi:hypothetical protein